MCSRYCSVKSALYSVISESLVQCNMPIINQTTTKQSGKCCDGYKRLLCPKRVESHPILGSWGMMGVIAGQGYHQYEGQRERGPGELEEPGVLCD